MSNAPSVLRHPISITMQQPQTSSYKCDGAEVKAIVPTVNPAQMLQVLGDHI